MICRKTQNHCSSDELGVGDGWIALSLAKESGLVLSSWVGKHPDALAEALIVNREGKTAWGNWQTDGWQGYQRHLPEAIDHAISKALTQRLEGTNGMVRQYTGRWH